LTSVNSRVAASKVIAFVWKIGATNVKQQYRSSLNWGLGGENGTVNEQAGKCCLVVQSSQPRLKLDEIDLSTQCVAVSVTMVMQGAT
jgi:hypothetical protein